MRDYRPTLLAIGRFAASTGEWQRTLELVIDHLDPLQASYDAVAEEYVRRGPSGTLGAAPVMSPGISSTEVLLSLASISRRPWVACAKQLNPTISFKQRDFRRLPVLDHTLAGIVAFYSIIHLSRQEVKPTLVEWRRAIKVGGLLLLAVHLGEEALHLDEWWGHRVSVDFAYFQTPELIGYLEAAGWHIEETTERDPYPGVETQTRRGYMLANATLP